MSLPGSAYRRPCSSCLAINAVDLSLQESHGQRVPCRSDNAYGIFDGRHLARCGERSISIGVREKSAGISQRTYSTCSLSAGASGIATHRELG